MSDRTKMILDIKAVRKNIYRSTRNYEFGGHNETIYVTPSQIQSAVW